MRNGAAVFRSGEVFTTGQLGPRAPRSAVGQLPGRAHRPRRGRRPSAGVQRRADELRAGAGARPPRRGDGHGARQRRLHDDGLRRDAAQPTVRREATADLDGADAPLPRRVRAGASRARLTQRRRRGRDPRPAVSNRAALRGDVTLRAPDGSTPLSAASEQPAGTYPVPFRDRRRGRRRRRDHAGRFGDVDVRGEGRRRPRPARRR